MTRRRPAGLLVAMAVFLSGCGLPQSSSLEWTEVALVRVDDAEAFLASGEVVVAIQRSAAQSTSERVDYGVTVFRDGVIVQETTAQRMVAPGERPELRAATSATEGDMVVFWLSEAGIFRQSWSLPFSVPASGPLDIVGSWGDGVRLSQQPGSDPTKFSVVVSSLHEVRGPLELLGDVTCGSAAVDLAAGQSATIDCEADFGPSGTGAVELYFHPSSGRAPSAIDLEWERVDGQVRLVREPIVISPSNVLQDGMWPPAG